MKWTEAHWFSHQCPNFTVFDLDHFHTVFGVGHQVCDSSLRHAGLERAARWCDENSDLWTRTRMRFQKLEHEIKVTEFSAICWGEIDYPEKLKRLAFPPPILFYRGDRSAFRKLSVAIVGARHPTHLGRLWVQDAVPFLVHSDLAIVSGGARGIDAEAHEAAIRAGGSTIAFLPSGVDEPYPVGNRPIFAQILKKGLLVSEFLPGTPVRAENFHRRNRLIAGAANVTVIVEAARKSGTIMTANRAIQENLELCVVPGPPQVASYSGSLDLIKQGSSIVCDGVDVVNFLNEKNVLKKTEESPTLGS